MSDTRPLQVGLLLILVALTAGCEVIGGIFKAGMAVGVILVVLVLGLAVWLLARTRA